MDKKVSEVIEEGADIIEAQGWVSGGGWNDGPLYLHSGDMVLLPRCIEGSIEQACGVTHYQRTIVGRNYSPQLNPAITAVIRHLGGIPSLTAWNDDEDRSEQEVLDAMRGAAKAQRRWEEGLDG